MKPAGVSWRPLSVLAAAVLAAHLLMLRSGPSAVGLADARVGRALVTRTVEVAPPQPPAPAAAPSADRPRPARNATPGKVSAVAQTAAPTQRGSREAKPRDAAPREAAPQAAASFAIPGSVRLHYQVSVQRRNQLLQTHGELAWRHDGDRYEAKLEVSAPALPARTQRSTGRITADGLAPLRFSDKARSEEAAHFEREQGKVSFSSNRPDAALLHGAQDRLSVLLQLGAMVAGNPSKFGPATTIAVQTAGTREAEPWLFTVEGEEELQLPGGTVATLKLTRLPRKEYDQKVELWLAPGMDYVPVRLRLTQPNGDWLDQQWSSTDRG